VGSPLPVTDTPTISAQLLDGAVVDDFLALAFPSGFSSSDWQNVFNDAIAYSQLKAANAQIVLQETLTFEQEMALQDNIISITTILSRLYTSRASYMLNFGTNYGCALQALSADRLKLNCNEDFKQNLDLPIISEIVELTPIKRTARALDSTQGIKIRIESRDTPDFVAQWGQFKMQLELIPEMEGQILALKGQMKIEPGSYFRRVGSPRSHHTYGHGELRLRLN
jgi:hypothetical protein